MPTMQAPTYMSGAQLAAMSPTARQQYFSQLSPKDQAAAQAAYQAALYQLNRDYMKKTVRKKSVCPPSSGSGLTQAYSYGANLSFNAPGANNGFLEGFYVYLNLHFDLAAGSSAVYAATASRELALINEIDVLYNGTQFKFKPYILKPLRQIMGYLQQAWPGSVLVGNHNTETDNYLTQGALPVSTGTNKVVTLEFYVPLNMLHPQDVRGLLPIDGASTTAQINIQCASQPLGNDPVLNTWYAVSGTGHAVTLNAGNASTVQVIAAYRDGTSYTGPSSLPVNLAGLGTVQFQQDVSLTGLTAGQIYRQKITLLEQHYYVIHTIIDGQQAANYALESNVNYLDLTTDSTGSNAFWKVGTGTNLSVQEWFNDIRDMLGYDLDEGIWPTVFGPVYMEPDPSNLNGSHVLNCDPTRGGWTDVHYGVMLNSLAATLSGVTPRIETHLVYVNPQGLVATA
jgi:hypothetical protein